MSSKKELGDYMKYLPLAVMAVSLISGYTLLQSRLSNAEEKVKDIEEIKISMARQEVQQDNILEILKEIKKKIN